MLHPFFLLRNRLLTPVAAGIALCCAPAADARNNKYVWKITNLNQTYHINFANPANCDSQTIDGAMIWNSASKFKANYGNMFDGQIVRNTPGVQISFEPASNMVNGANTPAEAPPGSSTGTVTIDGVTLVTVRDADIRVNADHWVGNYVRCGTSTAPLGPSEIDFARLIGHEMGHVVGVDDQDTNNSCLSWYALQYQKPLVPPCSTEAGYAVRLNGTP